MIDSTELPESTAGLQNTHDITIHNDTDYNITELKIKPNRDDCELKHGQQIKSKGSINGQLIFECSEDIEEDEVEIALTVSGVGSK